jgi:hypothetical protein
MTQNTTGIIAGNGRLPDLALKNLFMKGKDIVFIDLIGERDFSDKDVIIYQHINPGKINKAITFLKNSDVKEVVFAGKMEKLRLFKDIKPDLRAMKILTRMSFKGDRDIMKAIVSELAKEGIKTLKQTEVFKDNIVPESTLTPFKIPDTIKRDVDEGAKIARIVADAGIGQTVVIKDGIITAVESIEGTDITIKRGAKYANKGFTVVKVASENQDLRFDLPTVGLETLEIIKQNGGTCLAVQAGVSIMIDRDDMIKNATDYNIHIIGI